MGSSLFNLKWADIIKGIAVAVIGAVLTTLLQLLQNGGEIDWKSIGVIALIAGISYIVKNFFSDSQGRIGGKI